MEIYLKVNVLLIILKICYIVMFVFKRDLIFVNKIFYNKVYILYFYNF